MTATTSASNLMVYRLPAERPAPKWESANAGDLSLISIHLQRCFDILISNDPRLAEYLFRMRKRDLKVVVFGGWARDRIVELLHGFRCPSRDIDLVAHGDNSVAKALPESAARNPFGGFGVEGDIFHLDAWDLRDTFLIKRLNLPVSFEQLPYTADYNVNAIVFEPVQFFEKAAVLDAGAVRALRAGTLDFAANEVAQPIIQAARSMILAARLQMTVSETIQAFLRDVCITKNYCRQVLDGINTYCPPEWKSVANSCFMAILKA